MLVMAVSAVSLIAGIVRLGLQRSTRLHRTWLQSFLLKFSCKVFASCGETNKRNTKVVKNILNFRCLRDSCLATADIFRAFFRVFRYFKQQKN